VARDSLQKAQRGIDPVTERQGAEQEERNRQAAPAARQRDTLAAVIDRCLGEHGKKRWQADTFAEVKRCFDHDVKPALGARPVDVSSFRPSSRNGSYRFS
jgi:hypothetical protein